MGCIIALMGLVVPRFTLFLMWVFGFDRMDWAIGSWFVGFLGFLLLPYTTLFYILCYAPVAGVSGLGWFLVAMGFLMDLASHFGGGKQGQTYYADRYGTA